VPHGCGSPRVTPKSGHIRRYRPQFVASPIVVLTILDQVVNKSIDRCDRIGRLGHIDVIDMPV
jgi:hypothetical protein